MSGGRIDRVLVVGHAAKAEVGPAGEHEALVQRALAQVVAERARDRLHALRAALPQERRIGDRHLGHPVHQADADRAHLERALAHRLRGVALVAHLRVGKDLHLHLAAALLLDRLLELLAPRCASRAPRAPGARSGCASPPPARARDPQAAATAHQRPPRRRRSAARCGASPDAGRGSVAGRWPTSVLSSDARSMAVSPRSDGQYLKFSSFGSKVVIAGTNVTTSSPAISTGRYKSNRPARLLDLRAGDRAGHVQRDADRRQDAADGESLGHDRRRIAADRRRAAARPAAAAARGSRW